MKDIVSAPAARATHLWMGTTYRVITSLQDGGGVISVADSTSPAGFGPPRHMHSGEDEALVVLSGALEWWLEGETVFIPRGAEHAWRVIGDAPCRHLVVVTPGGLEGFFVEMAEKGYRIPEDMEAVSESAARHHMTFTGPPLGAEAR
jgi:quercetin dioxygenase-like cupin family protein